MIIGSVCPFIFGNLVGGAGAVVIGTAVNVEAHTITATVTDGRTGFYLAVRVYMLQ